MTSCWCPGLVRVGGEVVAVAAQSGWVGVSAAALGTRIATWLDASRRLLIGVGDHALELSNDAIGLAAVE